MIKFILSSEPIYPSEMSRLLVNNTVGALVTFEGWVRNHNQGGLVVALEYEVYEILAQKEGEKILQEAQTKFNLSGAVACHRQGYLNVGEIAVWVGATAVHRGAAFAGTRYIINRRVSSK
jgi:molybdopterin synthase catalytic subunit